MNYLDILNNNDSHIDNIFNSSINAVTEISRFPYGAGKLSLAAGILGTVLSVASASRTIYSAYSNWKASKEYTITVTHPNKAYEVVQDWVSELVSPEDIHELIGSASAYIPKDKRPESYRFVNLEFNQEMTVPFDLNGHKVTISAYIDEETSTDGSSPENSAPSRRLNRAVRTITLTAKTVAGYNEISKELDRRVREAMDSLENPPMIFMSDKWGDFSSRKQAPRDLDSVILDGGVVESITNHVNTFLDSEKLYTKMNMPYHTGLLLYGPPGTGKTSIVKGLSTKFSMNIYHINLRSMEDDAQLFDEFAAIPPRSLILLEDIDVSTPSAGDREGINIESVGITPSGLLNVLDGTMSPHGSIIVMTTNDLDSMDPSITRAGRIDFRSKIDYMTNDQLKRTCSFYLGRIPQGLPTITKDDEITSSEVTGVFRTHINDLENVDSDLVHLITAKVQLREVKSVDV